MSRGDFPCRFPSRNASASPRRGFRDPGSVTTWVPGEAADRFYGAYQPAPGAATLRRARGWAVIRALAGLHVGDAGVHGRPGGKATWGPPAHAVLRRLIATAHR
ncbi:hypothetical protein ACWEU6_08235 [Streptosporangium sandarakinum]|uniref:hypothetical protein n=1 Tax=Streptosporangium sandarakinum TaxID=1260955 RepID=UPI0036C78A2D